MVETDQRHSKVMDHYRRLAPEYGARANQTCEKAYRRLVQRFLRNRCRVLELGSGSSDLLDQLETPFAVACDLSWEMLLSRSGSSRAHGLVAAGERLPFRDASFDGLFLINVLEHVADLKAVLQECARTLQEGGLWLAVTPNGNWEFWLDLAERWSLKIPEGPHVFVTPKQLRTQAQEYFDVLEHRTFLMLPAGPPGLASLIDRALFCNTFGWGFFQYIVGQKRPSYS